MTIQALPVGLENIKNNWGWLLAFGILSIIAGSIALGSQALTTMFSVLFLGWMLIVVGVVQEFQAFMTRSWSGFFSHALAGILFVVIGIILVTHPLVAAETLTLIMAVFFLVGGLFRIISSLALRHPKWIWAVINGVITLMLGILIANQWPLSGIWFIGIALGIDLIFSGWSYIMLALSAKSAV